MKKILKYLGILIVCILLLAGIGFLYISIKGIPTYKAENPDIHVSVTPERVEKGKKLAEMLCIRCHFDPKTNKVTGKYMDDAPEEFGEIHSRNITQHKTKGIGNWTDGQLVYMLRTGIRPTGEFNPPYMVKLPHMSNEDLYSIIAFLKSDDPRVQAADVDNIPTKPTFLTKFLCYVAFKPFEMPKNEIRTPDINTDKVAFGKYLVTGVLDCYQCHSADFKTNDALFPEKSAGFCGGGNKLLNHDRMPVKSANITPDAKTGLGNWTLEDFITTLKFGRKPNNTSVRYPMEPYPQLSDEEASAIYAYLRTIPAIDHKIN